MCLIHWVTEKKETMKHINMYIFFKPKKDLFVTSTNNNPPMIVIKIRGVF